MSAFASNPLFERVADDLATHGWTQQNIFLPEDLTLALAQECRNRAQAGQMNQAGIGSGIDPVIKESIRGDSIMWLNEGQSPSIDRYLNLMDSFKNTLNQSLFLGLEDYECHFAWYPPGAYYKKHLDRFRDDDRRTVTSVLYLNEGWLPEFGGEMRMHLGANKVYDVSPRLGTMMFFMSADWPHEVLAATKDRLSIAGWFRRRADNPLFV
ncbi:2OG-Fe(II) oxygenase [Pseudomonas sp. F1_0610]|uniref:2OG-Fe(II) oxygenase n=1 Tax=Pseudomonas sp. F1_0610 TaxID=3114284 RepID=UPI0039C02201